MTTRMLIDARHREETRVAVVQGNRIEEFDFESAEHKQLKGNIYLAKVTRVEPSLQAAFVEYGGNRHGFLAFSEIHPDYYQIPKSDRDALLAEEAEHAAEEEKLREAEEGDLGPIDPHHDDDGQDHDRPDADAEGDVAEATNGDDNDEGKSGRDESRAIQELKAKRLALRRRYKIQDVIKRRQVMLVQVVKEERGNKGAALTTYLSLAGRYCVLMPNTAHGGGISRRISNSGDRKRLKSIMTDLKLPPTIGCIVRTAGLSRTKTEIKRDFDYLARLWDEIREKTLSAQAPAEIHGDSDLIKRAIRDIYHKDIEDVLVEGEDGYRAAKEFMKLLMPSHAKKVKPYSDVVPLFQHYHVEDQLNAMYNPVVQLKSGGYLVINPTEALVSIDINSGRSTREHGIEATALKTNLEAAKEIARQLRLRDMAGLVVIDFIDMESHSNDRKVEKALKEALKDDRARIQVGRISGFGLLEMSRQRLRTGVLEASTRTCPHCEGTGLVRTASSAGLSALRMLEEEAGRGRGSLLELRASTEAAFYVLNSKRTELGEIEERYGVTISVSPDGTMEGARMEVESSGPPPRNIPRIPPPVIEDDDDLDIVDEDEDEEEIEESREDREERDGDGSRRRRRRRRRGGRGRRDEAAEGSESSEDAGEEGAAEASAETNEGDEEGPRKRSRRGRRGGRRRGGREEGETRTDEAVEAVAVEESPALELAEETKPKRRSRAKKADVVVEAEVLADEVTEPAEKPKRAPRGKKAAAAETVVEAPAEAEKPKRKSRAKKADAEPAVAVANDEIGEDGEPRRGWWQRTFGP